jgi:hypothetical protein
MSLTNGRFVLHVTNQVRLSTGLGDVGERQRKALGHVQGEAPVGGDMLIEEGGESTPILRFHRCFPLLLSQNILKQ